MTIYSFHTVTNKPSYFEWFAISTFREKKCQINLTANELDIMPYHRKSEKITEVTQHK